MYHLNGAMRASLSLYSLPYLTESPCSKHFHHSVVLERVFPDSEFIISGIKIVFFLHYLLLLFILFDVELNISFFRFWFFVLIFLFEQVCELVHSFLSQIPHIYTVLVHFLPGIVTDYSQAAGSRRCRHHSSSKCTHTVACYGKEAGFQSALSVGWCCRGLGWGTRSVCGGHIAAARYLLITFCFGAGVSI